jgi:general secretion pathway protein G
MPKATHIKMHQKQTGFTIVELLIVIVVIGILAALAMGGYAQAQHRARVAEAKTDLATIKKAMLAYKQEFGELPPVGDAWNLDTMPPSPGYWNLTLDTLQTTKYLGSDKPYLDPWGSPYAYDDNDCNSNSLDHSWTGVFSVGPDKTGWTSDDVGITISEGCSYS